MDRYEISKVNLGKSLKSLKIYLFWAFWSLSLKFFLKEEMMKNINNQNLAELVHYIIIFYTQELGTCLGDTGILV